MSGGSAKRIVAKLHQIEVLSAGRSSLRKCRLLPNVGSL